MKRAVPRTVRTREQLAEVAEFYASVDEFVFDVETVGKRRGNPQVNRVTWLGLCHGTRVDVIPMGHPLGEMVSPEHSVREPFWDENKVGKRGKPLKQWRQRRVPAVFTAAPEQLAPGEVWKALYPAFFNDGIRKVGHNVKFDLESIAKYYRGVVPPGPYGDTLVLAHLLNSNLRYGLKDIIRRLYDHDYDQENIAKPDKNGENGIEIHAFSKAAKYTALDVRYTWKIWKEFVPLIPQKRLDKVRALEEDVLPVLLSMEMTGVPIDVRAMEDLGRHLRERMIEIEESIFSAAGEVFDLDSTPQKRRFVYETRGHKVFAWTSGGKEGKNKLPATSAGVLQSYAGDDPVIADLLDYALVKKLHSTYVGEKTADGHVGGLLEHTVKGRIHADFVQYGADTGRFSCVASDSLIEMPRDLAKYPDGVPITEVREGDWVYAFDWRRELVLKRVKWVAQTGVRETVVVTVENSEGHQLKLRATPEHLIRLRNGDWRPAGSLSHRWGSPRRSDGPRLMTMVRRSIDDGYVKFFPHSVARQNGVRGGGKSREHRWILEQVEGRKISTKADVHHIDGSRANNSVENLEALTIAQHRGRRHLHPKWGEGRNAPSIDLYTGPTDYRVVCVEPGVVEPVWDMEVEDVHNFIANGICVHNCRKPNLQNIPQRAKDANSKAIRKMFIADPEHSLVVADYSQIEYRVLAHFSGDPTLVKAFLEGYDPHAATMALLLDKALEDITPEERDAGKTTNFAEIYGAGPGTIAANAGVSIVRAKWIKAEYRKRFPKVQKWKYAEVERARRHKPPAVRTLTGRTRYLPALYARDESHRMAAERQVINTKIQGTAADIIKIAMVKLHHELETRYEGAAKIVLQVHDELGVMSPDEIVEDVRMTVQKTMESVDLLKVPMVAEAHIGKTWADAKG